MDFLYSIVLILAIIHTFHANPEISKNSSTASFSPTIKSPESLVRVSKSTDADKELKKKESLEAKSSILSHGIPFLPHRHPTLHPPLGSFHSTPFPYILHSKSKFRKKFPLPPPSPPLVPHNVVPPLSPQGILPHAYPFGFPLPPGLLPGYCLDKKPPSCSTNTTKPWCLIDFNYPLYEIQSAIILHKLAILDLYADVADLSTENSVIRPKNYYDENYLCPSETLYARPLRAVNTKGQWRTIVNNVKVEYDIFTQTVRLEECLTYGKSCGLVPSCYDSVCIQKTIYHRFLVYDPCDPILPFAIETFKLPSSCSCVIGELVIGY